MSLPFQPNAGGDSTVTIAATSASATSGTLTGQSNSGQESIRVYNSGLVPVFIKIGTSPTATVAASMPIAPGSVELFGIGSADSAVSAITASGTATIYITTGRGV